MTILRTVVRVKDNQIIEMEDIKSGEYFDLFEHDGELVGRYVADSDGHINEQGIGAVICRLNLS